MTTEVTTPTDRTADRIADLERRRAQAVAPGGPRRRGEFGARERIERLLDAGSFTETGQFVRTRPTGDGARRPYGDGVVTGHGTVDGRPVCVFAQDAGVFGGSMGEAFGEKTVALMDLALKTGCPVIGLNDSGGARIQEGVASLALYAELVRRNVQASGVIPQISVVLGPCAGGAAYSPSITDFTVMVDGASHMFVTGPDVIETVTGERTTAEDLGGARTSNSVSGNAHFLAAHEEDALDTVRDLLSYLPANNLERPPEYAPGTAPAGSCWTKSCPTGWGGLTTWATSCGPSSTTVSSSRCRSCSRRTSSAPSPAWRAARSGSSPTSRCTPPASSTSTPRRRPRGSYGSATRSALRC
ncbi:acetyl-coenzyme A carboxyl transferase alpha chain [Streptomyces sp. NL15-2K]|nr:acetyl-coenzyme A carboxyl transferase alpha chain [Streptomyces sp. NL15-2K]